MNKPEVEDDYDMETESSVDTNKSEVEEYDLKEVENGNVYTNKSIEKSLNMNKPEVEDDYDMETESSVDTIKSEAEEVTELSKTLV